MRFRTLLIYISFSLSFVILWLAVVTHIALSPSEIQAKTGIGIAKTAVIQSEYGPIAGSYQQLSITDSTAVSLTVPTGAYIAHIQAYDGALRYRDDGTAPTASVGMSVASTGDIWYDGDLDAIQLISESGTVETNVLYYGR